MQETHCSKSLCSLSVCRATAKVTFWWQSTQAQSTQALSTQALSLPCVCHVQAALHAAGLRGSALGRSDVPANAEVPDWLKKWAALTLEFVRRERELLPAVSTCIMYHPACTRVQQTWGEHTGTGCMQACLTAFAEEFT